MSLLYFLNSMYPVAPDMYLNNVQTGSLVKVRGIYCVGTCAVERLASLL